MHRTFIMLFLLALPTEGVSQTAEPDTSQPEPPEGFVLVEAGTFTMGSPDSEPYRDDDETQHEVRITRDYYLQATEVTQGQWRRLMGSNPSYFTQCGNDCPVERVNWHEALRYLNALSESEGLEPCYRLSRCRGTLGGGCGGELFCIGDYVCDGVESEGLECEGYRLPTEAEWEYAARAGSTTAYYSGGNSEERCGSEPNLERIGWYCGNSAVSYSGCVDVSRRGGSTCAGPHPAAGREANAWGLYDMSGNVWEWAWDWFGGYPSGSVTDPEGANTSSIRVFRGGGWGNRAKYARSAYRDRCDPASRNYNLGLRPARTVNP